MQLSSLSTPFGGLLDSLGKRFPLSSSPPNRFNVKRFARIYSESKPLTVMYKDGEGRSIQIWKARSYGLIGAVFDLEGNLTIVPGTKIYNPLNRVQDPQKLMECLEKSPRKNWDIVFDSYKLSLTIWPHLLAGGKDIPDDRVPPGLSKSNLPRGLESALKSAEGKPTTTSDGKLRYQTPFKSSDRPGPTAGHRKVTTYDPKTGEVRCWMECYDKNNKVVRTHLKHVNGQQVYGPHDPPTWKDRMRSTIYRSLPDVPGTRYPSGGPKTHYISKQEFYQRLQQTRLTDSYNSTHRQNPVPAKGGTGGNIGGVACSTAYMEGLFDDPATLFEHEHFFCLPSLPDGKAPFSDLELRQILRELAIGVYVHSTIPFFSLHFNQNADQYPVIHPVYEHTLVGRVISMLDYMMKGYLNGGVFNEKFIDEWQHDPSWERKERTALQNLIDFTEYSQKHLSGEDQNYKSLRMFQKEMALIKKEGLGDKIEKELGVALGLMTAESPVLEKYLGFRNSFRIIAKQKSIQKEGNLFLVDADFDVLYTISPSPEYKAAVEEHFRKYGKLPSSFANMDMAYKLFADRIHDHMAKLPLCRDYFAMLAVINFFSGYFSTLKKHRKVPVLPTIQERTVTGCPSLFPHLPISSVIQETMRLNMYAALNAAVALHKDKFKAYCLQLQYDVLNKCGVSNLKERKELIDVIKKAIQDNVIASSSRVMRRLIEKKVNETKEIQEAMFKQAQGFLGSLDKIVKSRTESLIPGLVSSLDSLSDDKVQAIINQVLRDNKDVFANFFKELYNNLLLNSSNSDEENALIETIQTSTTNKFPHVAAYKAKELSESLVSGFKETFRTNVEKTSTIFYEMISTGVPNNVEDFFETAFTATRVKSEMEPEEVEIGKKVVGGCGMRLIQQSVQSSRVAAKVLQFNWERFQKMKPESWTEVTFDHGKSKGFVFRTLFEDVPASITDNYEWMESSLFAPKGIDEKATQERVEIQEAIEANDIQTFDKLIAASKIVGDGLRDRYQLTLLHHAARSQNPHFVKVLLKRLSVLSTDIYGYLPIHYAAMSGALDTLNLLVNARRSTINAVSRNGTSPLVCAIQNNERAVAQYLMAEGATGHTSNEGYTVLHCVLHHGNFDIIDDVLKNPALTTPYINQLSEEGGTPLTLACELDSHTLVERLINLKADPNITRKDRVSCIEIGIIRNCRPVVQSLLKFVTPSSHAIDTAAKQASNEILQLLMAKSYFYQHRNSFKDTVLHTAIRFGNLSGALLIVQNCNDQSFLAAENEEKETAYALAASMGAWDLIDALLKKNVVSKIAMIASLSKLLRLEYHPSLKIVVDACNFNSAELQKYALIAAQAGNYQALSFIFVPAGVKLESLEGPKHWRVPHYLAKYDGLNLFRLMIIKEKDFLQPLKEDGNRTLSYIAASHGSARVFRFLLEQMKKTNCALTSHFNDRHLLYGVLQGASIKCVRIFFEIYHERKKELTNAILNAAGLRPLHMAAKMCSLGILKFLIREDAEIKAEDANGYNVLCHALKAHAEKIISFLLKEYGSTLISPQAIFLAASEESEQNLKKLLQLNSSQETLDAALFIAIQEHNTVAFTRLRRHGATFNFTAKGGMTPLLLASNTGQGALLNEILKDKTVKPSFINGNSAVHEAAKNGYVHCVDLLFKAGFKNEKNQSGQFPIHLAKGSEGLRLLVLSDESYQKHISQLTTVLLSPKPNPDRVVAVINAMPLNEPIQIEYKGELIWGTPLQLFLRLLGKSIKKETITTLIQRTDLDLNLRDSDGNTLAHLLLKADIYPSKLKVNWTLVNHEKQNPVHIAAQYGSPKTLQRVLEKLKKLKIDFLIEECDEDGRTPIFCAIANNRDLNVDLLISYGANLEAYDNRLFTPLILAYVKPNPSLPIVKSLLSANANPNQLGTPARLSPLHLSIPYEQDEITRCLLFNGASCNAALPGQASLLHAAAQAGKLHLLRLFAAKGLSLETRDRHGLLPIHHAAAQGEAETLKAILSIQKGMLNAPVEKPAANPKQEHDKKENSSKFMEGATPLLLAAAQNEPEAIQYLMRENADVEVQTKLNSSVLSFAAARGSRTVLELFAPYKIARNPQYLCNAIGQAISSDNLDTVIHLYGLGVAINTEIANGFTGIQLASQHGSLLTTAWLLQNGADPLHPSPTGEDSLQLSAGNDSVEQFSLMLEFVAPDVDELRNNRETLLHTAAKTGKLSHVVYLLKNFASLNVKDSRGNLPIHLAIQNGHGAVVRLLLACGADFMAKTPNGKTLGEIIPVTDTILRKALTDFATIHESSTKIRDQQLHIAVRYGNPLAVLLLAYLDDVDATNGDGLTALHVAAASEQIALVMPLLNMGADVNAKNRSGKTVLAVTKNPELMDLLKNAGGKL